MDLPQSIATSTLTTHLRAGGAASGRVDTVGSAACGGCAVGEVALGAAAIGKQTIELGDGSAPSPQDWASFLQNVGALGPVYRPIARLLGFFGRF